MRVLSPPYGLIEAPNYASVRCLLSEERVTKILLWARDDGAEKRTPGDSRNVTTGDVPPSDS